MTGTVAGIGEHNARAHAPRPHPVECRQRQLVLRLIADVGRHPRRRAARRIVNPCLRQIQLPREREARRVGAQVHTHRDLTVRRLPERAAILARHADRLVPLLGETGFVNDQYRLRQQPVEHQRRERRLQRRPRPRTLIDKLPQRLDVAARHALRDRCDRLALAVEQEPANIFARVHLPLAAPEQRRQFPKESP